jgi:outer membrane murein-binding lipoprotein Lpp
MRRSIMLVTTLSMVTLLLVGCASSDDKISGACSTVKDVASSLPAITDDDGAHEIVPMIDKELAAAGTADQSFADNGASAAFKTAWKQMIGALRNDRKAWNDSLGPRAPGGDMVVALGLAQYKTEVDNAKSKLNAAAGSAGYPECGNTIAWRY